MHFGRDFVRPKCSLVNSPPVRRFKRSFSLRLPWFQPRRPARVIDDRGSLMLWSAFKGAVCMSRKRVPDPIPKTAPETLGGGQGVVQSSVPGSMRAMGWGGATSRRAGPRRDGTGVSGARSELKRSVALKVVRPEMNDRPSAQRRLRLEAEALLADFRLRNAAYTLARSPRSSRRRRQRKAAQPSG